MQFHIFSLKYFLHSLRYEDWFLKIFSDSFCLSLSLFVVGMRCYWHLSQSLLLMLIFILNFLHSYWGIHIFTTKDRSFCAILASSTTLTNFFFTPRISTGWILLTVHCCVKIFQMSIDGEFVVRIFHLLQGVSTRRWSACSAWKLIIIFWWDCQKVDRGWKDDPGWSASFGWSFARPHHIYSFLADHPRWSAKDEHSVDVRMVSQM